MLKEKQMNKQKDKVRKNIFMKFQDLKMFEEERIKKDPIFLSMKTTFQQLLGQYPKSQVEVRKEPPGSLTQNLFPLILLKLQIMLGALHEDQQSRIKLKQAFQNLSVQINRKIRNSKRLQHLQSSIESIQSSFEGEKQIKQKQSQCIPGKIQQRKHDKYHNRHLQASYPNSTYHTHYYQHFFYPQYYDLSFRTSIPNNYPHYPPKSYIDWQSQRRMQYFQPQNTRLSHFQHHPIGYTYNYPDKFNQSLRSHAQIQSSMDICKSAIKSQQNQSKVEIPSQNGSNQKPTKKIKLQ